MSVVPVRVKYVSCGNISVQYLVRGGPVLCRKEAL